jgi:hypothetical protein
MFYVMLAGTIILILWKMSRRTFACLLAKKGIDSLHIMRLGRWESIQMVERYTRSVRFEDSLKFYRAPLSEDVSLESRQ